MKHAAILKQYLIYQKNSPPKNDTYRDVVIMKYEMCNAQELLELQCSNKEYQMGFLL